MSQSVETPNTVAAADSIGLQIFETRPDRLTLHMIEDHQLEALTNISRPISLALAGAATGGFLGLVPASIVALGRVGTTQFTAADMASALICVSCVVAGIISWPLAIRGELAANKAIKGIRERAQHQL